LSAASPIEAKMAEEIVIRAERLSKKYIIGHAAERERYVALRDVMARGARNLWRKAALMARGGAFASENTVEEEFWALKDISFEVKRGEVLGIIGRNGAGKSTLLKILSRITEPTEGRVTINGRVASLLEIGTGFHPELTDRENVYLNGAILGMTRAETRRKFDEIVAFAEIEKFLDTPVKRYSSGMYVRLAFAVAAHLEPEILVVDEVLAVGDAEFQKKCLGKMDEVSRRMGRTVLFVSHNMGALASLCQTAILLKNGRIVEAGPTDRIIQLYSNVRSEGARIEFSVRPDAPSIAAVSIDPQALRRGALSVSIEYTSPYPLRPIGGIVISNTTGIPIWGSNGRFHTNEGDDFSSNTGVLICEATGMPLVPSNYILSAWLGDWYHDFDEKRDVLSFDFRPETLMPMWPGSTVAGHVDWPASWRFRTRSAVNRGGVPSSTPAGITARSCDQLSNDPRRR
jgi:lipopolysaccharide transport system ATP-binding protein